MDATAEGTNRQAGMFRHKRQSVSQAIAQIDSIDCLKSELNSLENNLVINWENGRRCFKDDRETKLRFY